MSDQTERKNTAIYTPIEYMSFEEWTASRVVRAQRIKELVLPMLERLFASSPNPETRKFMHTTIEVLEEICQRRFTNQGNPPSEIPIYCLLDGKHDGQAMYNFDGLRGVHQIETLLVTQTLVNALCPEFGINFADNLEESLRKVSMAQNFGYASLHAINGRAEFVEFSTILPGVTLWISYDGDEKYISLDWKVM